MTNNRLLIILNGLSNKEKSTINDINHIGAEILNLSDEIDSNYGFKNHFIAREEILKIHQKNVIEYVIDWVNQIGSKQILNGKNIKHILNTPTDISMWWFNALQLKDFGDNPLYNKLVFLNIIDELLTEKKYDKIVIFGGDQIFRKTIKDSFKNSVLTLSCHTNPNMFFFETRIFLTGVFKTFAYTFLLLKRILFIKRNYKKDVVEKIKHDVTFLGLHPCSLLNKNNNIVERYYGALPATLKQKGLNVGFISVFCELKENKNDFNKKYLKSLNKYGFDVILLETLLSFKDIFSILYIYLKTICRFYLLPIDVKKKLFIYKEKDLYHLLGRDFFNSLYLHNSFKNLLISESAYKYGKKFNPDCLISCYTFNFVGRAINHGIRRYDQKKSIIGIQHASMTMNKVVFRAHNDEINVYQHINDRINYIPFPDYYITQGYMAYDLMVSNGFPKERCFVCGSPRFDNLYSLSRKLMGQNHIKVLPKVKNGNPNQILVATSYSKYDSIQLIDLVFKAMAGVNCIIIFKPHPNCPISDILDNYSYKFSDVRFSLSDENINELMMKADILVTTYSTVAEEAVAIGKPAISVHAGVHVNMSSFENLNLNVVRTPEEFRNEINHMFIIDENEFDAKRKYLIEQCFGKFDGHATERVVTKIYQILGWK